MLFYKYICQPHTFMPAFPIVRTLYPVPQLVFRRLQFGNKKPLPLFHTASNRKLGGAWV